MNITDVDDEDVEIVQDVLATHAHEKEMYVAETGTPSRIVSREPPITISQKDADTVEEIAEELVALVEFFHPKLVNEVPN
jgi:hypothetical protein